MTRMYRTLKSFTNLDFYKKENLNERKETYTMNKEYIYQPTDLEDELFLSEVPTEIIQSSIKTQFEEPLEYRKKDYIQSFITKYEFSKENLLEDDMILLDLCRDKFLKFIEDIFYEYLSIGFNDLEDLSEEDQHDLIHLTYRFFIKNIKKNFVNVVWNYITNNKNEISQRYIKKKDVTSLNFKSEIENEYDVLVLANLGDIIDDIFEELKLLDDVNKFFELCEADEPILELEYVINAYNEMELTGNFIDNYIKMIDDEFITEIQSKIRNKILKKYPKRLRKIDLSDESRFDDSEDVQEENTEVDTEDK